MSVSLILVIAATACWICAAVAPWSEPNISRSWRIGWLGNFFYGLSLVVHS